MKYRVVRALQKFVINPPVRALLALGVAPPFYALLETTGRRTGKPRRTPVGNGSDGDTFWLITELGRRADYVRNIDADPRVRVRVRRGLQMQWRTGTAHILLDEDARARQRAISRGRPGRLFNAVVLRALGCEMLAIRIDLDPT